MKEEDCIEQLVRKNTKYVWKMAYSLANGINDPSKSPEDYYQEIMIRLYQGRKNIDESRDPAQIEGYIRRIIQNAGRGLFHFYKRRDFTIPVGDFFSEDTHTKFYVLDDKHDPVRTVLKRMIERNKDNKEDLKFLIRVIKISLIMPKGFVKYIVDGYSILKSLSLYMKIPCSEVSRRLRRIRMRVSEGEISDAENRRIYRYLNEEETKIRDFNR